MNYILFHSPCPDGTAAALAAYLKLSTTAEYIGVNYGQPVPEIPDGSDVWILDFSYPAKELLKLAERMKSVTVLDHHATAQQELCTSNFLVLLNLEQSMLIRDEKLKDDGFLTIRGNLRIRFDMTKSGAVLAWEHFHPGTRVPEFFRYVQDRDLWKFELPDSRQFSAGLRLYPMTLEGYGTAMTDGQACLIHAGGTAMDVINQAVDAMCKNARLACFDGKYKTIVMNDKVPEPGLPTAFVQDDQQRWFSPVVNASVYFSEVGERLLELYPHAPFSAYYFDRGDGRRQWGLRSRPDFDTTPIARAWGGGGHFSASGFTQTLT